MSRVCVCVCVCVCVQVELTADYAPNKLLELLSSSTSLPLEAALAICEEKGLVPEQVRLCVCVLVRAPARLHRRACARTGSTSHM